MKFIHYLAKTENIEWIGTSAFILFFLIFLLIIIQVFTARKSEMAEISSLPLNDQITNKKQDLYEK
jgi:cbb3-type cytochrome oxidase subunit 3